MAKLTIVGPNLPNNSKPGDIHVHAAGCADLTRGIYRQVPSHEKHTEEHDSIRSVVESFYGPDAGSFYEEAYGDDIPPDVWKEYAGEFWFAPCVKDLPEDDTEPELEDEEPEPVGCDVHPGTSTFRIGTRVAFVGDPRVTGIVAGHGTVDNAVDPRSDDNETYPVVIVALDKIEGSYATHMAFVSSALRSR